MYNIQKYEGRKQIPFIHPLIKIDADGQMVDESDHPVSLESFNHLTGLCVKSNSVLSTLTYQKFNWPPMYWRHLVAKSIVEGVCTPESTVLTIEGPVESLEFPGFFMIPGFSDYAISKEGRLIRKSSGVEITASEGVGGYFTFRMTNDTGKTQNQPRHRILCFAFKPYPANFEELDVNHINGKPGEDHLDNLEWATRSENMMHAYALNLRNDNIPVQVRNIAEGVVFIFGSCSAAAREFAVTMTTISNRAKTNGYTAYDGYQFRFHPNSDPWPEFERLEGKFLVEFPNGESLKCSSKEAALHAGLTRTSLLRMLREGRCFGTTQNKITRTN
jgi:hypothetical protein